MTRSKEEKRDVDATQQPDETFRRTSAASDDRYESEHRETTESNRWDDAGESVEERGYPPEGTGAPRH